MLNLVLSAFAIGMAPLALGILLDLRGLVAQKAAQLRDAVARTWAAPDRAADAPHLAGSLSSLC